MYSFRAEGECDEAGHWPPEMAAQKRPVVQVHDISDGEEEPPKVRRRQGDEPPPAFGAALGRLILGQEALVDEIIAEANRLGPAPLEGQASPASTDREETLASEVSRISRAPADDVREILGLGCDMELELPVVQSRYRQIMRLLHPDKRSAEAEASAGGRVACEEAFQRVQIALEAAKKEIEKGPDPCNIARQSMRRMQELQRQRTQQAMQRQREDQAGGLMKDLATASRASPEPGRESLQKQRCGPSAESTEEDATAQEIMQLLAQMNRS